MAEKEKFTQSDDLLVSVVLRQAGTAVKAIMEAVQNCKDSGAKHINIEVTTDGFKVQDDGCGMSEEDIKNHFKVFGNSSKKGNKDMIGEFGMGRGQIFAQGVTDYYTRNSHLHVDLVDEGFGYTRESIAQVPGTLVICKFFNDKKIALHRLSNIENQLASSFFFPDITVSINGKVPTPIVKQVFTEGQFAAYEVAGLGMSGHDSNLYVKGIYVRQVGSVEPFVITSKDLTLNFARNDLIVDDKFHEMSKFLTSLNAFSVKGWDRRKGFPYAGVLCDLLRDNKVTKEELFTMKCLRSYEGEVFYSAKFVAEHGGFVTDVSDVDSARKYKVADMIKNKMGGVICDLQDDGKALCAVLGINVKSAEEDDDISKLIEELLNQTGKKIEEDTASKKQKQYFHYIRVFNRKIAEALDPAKREVRFVTEANYEASTDGSSYIKYNIDTIGLMDPKPVNAIKIAHTLIHEYVHDGDDSNGKHDAQFYERFHDWSCRKQVVEVIGLMASFYLGDEAEEE